MARSLCYTRDGRDTYGPVSWRELRRMALEGLLRPTDLVGEMGMLAPRRAGDVEGLFSPNPGEWHNGPGGVSEQITL